MAPVIRAEGVRKVYRNGSTVEALAGVDLQIRAGELLAVVGPAVRAASLPPAQAARHLD
jgi:ABC-type multidrug transport system ATPase subunit